MCLCPQEVKKQDLRIKCKLRNNQLCKLSTSLQPFHTQALEENMLCVLYWHLYNICSAVPNSCHSAIWCQQMSHFWLHLCCLLLCGCHFCASVLHFPAVSQTVPHCLTDRWGLFSWIFCLLLRFVLLYCRLCTGSTACANHPVLFLLFPESSQVHSKFCTIETFLIGSLRK